MRQQDNPQASHPFNLYLCFNSTYFKEGCFKPPQIFIVIAILRRIIFIFKPLHVFEEGVVKF